MDDAWAQGEFEALRDGLERAWRMVESAFASLRRNPGCGPADEAAARAGRDKAYYVYATASRRLDARRGAPSPNTRLVVAGAMRKLGRFEAALSRASDGAAAQASPRGPILDSVTPSVDHVVGEPASSDEAGATAAPDAEGAGTGASTVARGGTAAGTDLPQEDR